MGEVRGEQNIAKKFYEEVQVEKKAAKLNA